MMAAIGYTALFLALIASICSLIGFALAARNAEHRPSKLAQTSLLAVCGLVSVSIVVLTIALLTHDFQIEYVASYTSTDMDWPYLISALWAGNSGSLLFWAWFLSIFATVLMLQQQRRHRELLPYAALILMVNEIFFLFMLTFVSNPFQRLPFTPPQGMGLNPMLENPGMIFHPPAIVIGYVGLTVPFALAIAALMSGRLGHEWIVTARRWILIAWLLLGVGNIIGAWWAYAELGWGGYWAWDPVENAGLMPWLVATAFLHSTMLQRRRGMFKVWNMVLIIVTYTLVIFGTFLTRSGVLSSVHTFDETNLGPFFLFFIFIILFGSLGLLAYRYGKMKNEAEVESLLSRESMFWINNILLVGATAAVFVGTIFPAISEAVMGIKVEVGAPFFNKVDGPIFLAIILLIGLCSLIGWRRTSAKNLLRNFLGQIIAAVIVVIALFIAGIKEWPVLVAIFLCSFALFTVIYVWFRETQAHRRIKKASLWNFTWAHRARYGGYLVHIAIVIIAVGVIGSSFYSTETEGVLKPGESISLANYMLRYENLDYRETQTKLIITTKMSVYQNEKLISTITPEKTFHLNYQQPVTEVSIHSTPLEDLYVILVDWEEDGSAAFKVLINPLVSWIWIGGIIFLIGGLISFSFRQRWPAASGDLKLDKGEDSR